MQPVSAGSGRRVRGLRRSGAPDGFHSFAASCGSRKRASPTGQAGSAALAANIVGDESRPSMAGTSGYRRRPMVVIGLTGGIGAGKSTVGAMLVQRGAVLADGDRIVRQIQQPGAAAYGPIAERFGPGVLAADGTLDRP